MPDAVEKTPEVPASGSGAEVETAAGAEIVPEAAAGVSTDATAEASEGSPGMTVLT